MGTARGLIARLIGRMLIGASLILSATYPHVATGATAADDWLDQYDVIWTTPSADCHGSMPLGNGDIGLNAWAQADGDVCFYIGKTDLWGDNGRLLKLGLVRVRLSPNPFAAGVQFRQQLHLRDGTMTLTSTPPGSSSGPTTVRLWVDANHPVIHLTIDSPTASDATASFELWRKVPTSLPSIEVSDLMWGAPAGTPGGGPTIVEPDTVLRDLPEAIGWYHRNVKSVGPEVMMRTQDLLESPWTDPLIHRTMGAVIRADGGQRLDDQHLASAGQTRHCFNIYVLTQQPATAEAWLASMQSVISRVEAQPPDGRLAAHREWWNAFWDRSKIDIHDRPSATDSPGQDVARGYQLQRFITACAGRGAYPIKFNGSIFVVPHPGGPGDADYRQWGPGYWWQNTRFPYSSMCTAGDFDLMQPLFHMYAGEVLAVSKYRTERYFGWKDAAYYPECIYPWAAIFPVTYGWTPAAERKDKLQDSLCHKWAWVGGLELACLMLDYYDHTQDEGFLAKTVLPTALPQLRFFDHFYKTGADGKLVMHPSQAVETWVDCTNPMTEVAGLRAVCDRLLALPKQEFDGADRTFVESFSAKVPPLPTREADGVKLLAAADRFARKSNCENPELYAVYPFRLVSFEKDNAGLGIEALHRREDRGAFGWRQDDLFMAYLGLTDEVRPYVVERARKKNPESRFPAFWGPNYDWTPDQDHGGVLMKVVQAMLIQTEGRKIFLLPAWPQEWDVDFKLHAPYRTTLEGSVRGGKLTALQVDPEARRADVQIIGSAP